MLTKRQYNTVHVWMLRTYKKSGICKHCGRPNATQWANISGEYKRNRDDWLELCVRCHADYDHGGRWWKSLSTGEKNKQLRIQQAVTKDIVTGLIY